MILTRTSGFAALLAVLLMGAADAGQAKPAAKVLHIAFPSGGSVDIDAETLDGMPGVKEALVERLLDPAKDGLLSYRLPEDLPEGVTVEKIKGLIAKVSKKVKVEYDGDIRLLLVSDGDEKELRKVVVLMRSLGFSTVKLPEPVGPDEGDGADDGADDNT